MRKSLLAGLVLVSAAPVVLAAPPHEKIERIRVTVNCANDEWTAIPLSVESGDLVFVEASGQCLVGSWTGKVGPDGQIGHPGQPNGNGMLTMKVGDSGSIPVGSHYFLNAPESGPVKLRVHDTKYGDNGGELTAVITRVPAGMLPKLPAMKDATASGTDAR